MAGRNGTTPMPSHPMAFRCFRSDDLSEVLRIQEDNLIANLSTAQQADGFLSVAFSAQQVVEMDRDIPIVVADCGDRLGGYMCGSTLAASAEVPLLARMMSIFPETMYGGRSLDRFNAYIYGPVCVERALRGTGVLEGLFAATLKQMAGRYEIGVLFVSLDNPRSMRAHTRKLGMRKLCDFSFMGRDFGLLVFDCK